MQSQVSLQIFISLLAIISVGAYDPKTNHRCIGAVRNIAASGDGTTESSCMDCNPTKLDCPSGCQAKVKDVFWECDDVCLPVGYHFDPSK